MTDGPTGIQVAPTEDEMNSVQDILKRAISAVVGMSQLQADVDMLRSTVASLQSDTERLRQQNAGLDEGWRETGEVRAAEWRCGDCPDRTLVALFIINTTTFPRRANSAIACLRIHFNDCTVWARLGAGLCLLLVPALDILVGFPQALRAPNA